MNEGGVRGDWGVLLRCRCEFHSCAFAAIRSKEFDVIFGRSIRFSVPRRGVRMRVWV